MRKFKRFLSSSTEAASDTEVKSGITPNTIQAASTSQAVADAKIAVTSNYENHLSLLSRYDIVLVVDDSGSMSGGRWKEVGISIDAIVSPHGFRKARTALQALAVEAAKYDADGIEIQFLNAGEILTTSNSEEVEYLFKHVKPAGYTPLGTKIGKLLDEYMQRFTAAQPELKPVIYIVITDGEASDGPKTEEAVIRTARALDNHHAKPDQIGIQFVQIGNDSTATEYLEMLDDTLTSNAGIRDMVDTTTAKPGVKLDLIKVLLGSVNRRVDRKGSTVLFGGK
ncbi:hypothetical protein C0989_012243 [Termitomyces sp. Mn162]|nr:hypothetical protein C0989_012243 [Termitomyces sp. Mn162]